MKQSFLIILTMLALVILVAGCADKSDKSSKSIVVDVQDDKVQTKATVDNDVPVKDEKVYDFAINNMTVSSIDWTVGERVTIYPLVRNLGNSVDDLEIELYANDKRINKFQMSFKQGETKQLTYEWYPEEPGDYVIKTIIDPDDEFNDINPDNNKIKLRLPVPIS